MQRDVVVLPQPLSPTSASVSPGSHVEAHAVDRAHVADHATEKAPADREELLQALDFEERRARPAEPSCAPRRVEEARRALVLAHALERRLGPVAALRHEVGAARMEGTSGRPVVRMRDGAG